ncbi:M23 family metallopeptidase [Fulvimarina sp. MAC3]|uniref:M23 family metallopeptidase n=1 Tax=Fulvimarina sp. MAC3 TaxID=3148887 RepID=UPI0031FC3577
MHVLDPSFRETKQKRRRDRRRRQIVRICLAGLCVIAVVGAGIVYLAGGEPTPSQPPIAQAETDLDEELTPVEIALPDAEQPAPSVRPKALDLMGDPLRITLEQGGEASARARPVERPEDLGKFVPEGKVYLLSDTMVSSSERFMANLPSTQEEFAFFRAQQTVTADDPLPYLPDSEPMPVGVSEISLDIEADAETAGWGETISNGEEALPKFERTTIENTTSVALLRPDYQRAPVQQDMFVSVLAKRSLENLLSEDGFDDGEAEHAEKAAKQLFGINELEAGMIVAVRGLRLNGQSARWSVGQISIYKARDYIGTLARSDDGNFVEGADPWVQKDLFALSQKEGPAKQYRLLDAVYSTAMRNGVPSGVVGEAMMLLARGEDLSGFASPKDRFVLIYSDAPRDSTGGTSGRVLYAAIRRAEATIECFVYRAPNKRDFDCLTESEITDQVSVTVGAHVNGMVTPVKGVMTSTFGPRKHPILETVRIHKGVDWAAPTGTPVFAAFDGTVSYAGDGKGYGNLVKIDHEAGRATRYAHLSRFGEKAKVGTHVQAGDVIGYVGTTGLSTGPHLHFELYIADKAVDPLAPGSAPGAPTTQYASVGDERGAVSMLVNKIIRVESAGNARAKNPLSTATGLGQFIQSTWLRMMRTYRPDLARSLSRDDLLALRYDPTISREMVQNLALEGEAYLKARGHGITAGRLYLCHFLGMDGAHIVLSADSSRPLVDVLGYQVIAANPFLRGRSVGYVIDWAERKMHGAKASQVAAAAPSGSEPVVAQKTVTRTDTDFEDYKSAMQTIVKENGALF